MRTVRLLVLGFGLGAAVAFAVSLLRAQRLAQATGYQAPVAAQGPMAVTDIDVAAVTNNSLVD